MIYVDSASGFVKKYDSETGCGVVGVYDLHDKQENKTYHLPVQINDVSEATLLEAGWELEFDVHKTENEYFTRNVEIVSREKPEHAINSRNKSDADTDDTRYGIINEQSDIGDKRHRDWGWKGDKFVRRE